MLARLVSLCLLSLSIYTCYPVTQINLVNKYAASKVSLLYSMVFFCISATHSLANSFANAFFEYNVRRWRQAEIAFPKFSDHFPPAIRIYLGRMLGGDRNDACRRRACVRLTTERKKQALPARSTYTSVKKQKNQTRSLLCVRVSRVGTARARRKTASGLHQGGARVRAAGWLGYGILFPTQGRD